MKHRNFHIEGSCMGTPKAHEFIKSGNKYIAFAEPKNKIEIDQLQPKHRILLSAFMVPGCDGMDIPGCALRLWDA